MPKRKIMPHKKTVRKKTVTRKKRKYTPRVTRKKKVIVPKRTEIVLKAPPKPRRKKKQTAKIYFTQETEDAIIQYNNETDPEIRNQIYQDRIAFPLGKLVENVFNRWKFSYFKTSPQDVQKEALAHLVANMGKYDPNRPSKVYKKKKSKAFAYFSVVAKNWFILQNNTNYGEFQTHQPIGEDHEENTVQLQHTDKYYSQVETDEFMRLTIEFWEENVGKIFTKIRDLNIANAVIELLRNSQRIDAFNKKALYLYIREISECKTQQITKVINKMKQYHRNIYRMYLNDGIVSNSTHLPA